MRRRLRGQLANVIALVVIFALGAFAAGYVLLHERLPVPFANTYDVSAALTAADGVVPGLGQPVNVAGVQVGSISGARVQDGLALLTLQINRDQVPHIYANADVTLEPITPLGDLEIDLSPGGPPATPIASNATLGVGQTIAPIQLEDLLSSLDGDTRAWLASLIGALGEGVGGQGNNLRQALAALGPTAYDTRQIAASLAKRRLQLADLIHNLAIVTHAATSNSQLARLVVAGDQTLHALAGESTPLRQSVALLPGALDQLDTALVNLKPFATRLKPALTSLEPAVARLPQTFKALKPFTVTATRLLANPIRPFVADATPLIQRLEPTTQLLDHIVPSLIGIFKLSDYTVNELAYNPGGGNQGYLYWADWFFHNWDSAFGEADANGVVPRANILVNCSTLNAAGRLGLFLTTALGAAEEC
jgi:phospholipid/cholesterol/gamma-HCH transport system substrate-binding protein